MKIDKKTILEHIIVLEIYTLLTIIAFRKVFILGIDEWVIGDHGDAWQFIWNFWWVRKCILERRNIFYTDYLFYPHGTHLYFHTLNLSAGLIAFPLTFLTDNFVLIYNLMIFFSIVFSGYISYLFIYHLAIKWIKRFDIKLGERDIKLISVFSSFLFAFSPYVISKGCGYFDLISVYWLPLSLLFFLNMVETKGHSTLYMLLFIVSTIFSFFGNYYSFYYSFIFILIYIIFHIKAFLHRRVIIKLFVSVLSSLLVIGAIYYPGVKIYLNDGNEYVRPYFQTITFFNFFVPPPFVFSYNLTPRNLYHLYSLSPTFMPGDSYVYLGNSLFLLFLICTVYTLLIRKDIIKELSFLVFGFLFSLLISLGSSNLLSLALNNIMRQILPFFNLIAVPSRHFLLSILFYSMSFSFTLLIIFARFKSKTSLFVILFLLLFLLDYFPWHWNMFYHVPIPRILYGIQKDEKNITILNIPHKINTQGMYLQTIHEKKILDGQISRIPRESMKTLQKLEKLIKERRTNEAMEILKKNNVKYIIVNYNYGGDWDFSLLPLLNFTTFVDRRGNIEVYQVR